MVTAVAVQDIDGVNLIKIVLECVCREYAGYARIKTGAQDCSDACVLIFLLIGPLP